MISVTKLLGGPSFFGDRLRYDESSSKQQHGTRTGMGPVVVWNSTKTCHLECIHYALAKKSKFRGETPRGRAQTSAIFASPRDLLSPIVCTLRARQVVSVAIVLCIGREYRLTRRRGGRGEGTQEFWFRPLRSERCCGASA